MALFKKTKEQPKINTELIINTNHTWFTHGIPKYIIRQSITERDNAHKTLERHKNKGQDYINPVIHISDCRQLIENEQTIEIQRNSERITIIPKNQIIEIRY